MHKFQSICNALQTLSSHNPFVMVTASLFFSLLNTIILIENISQGLCLHTSACKWQNISTQMEFRKRKGKQFIVSNYSKLGGGLARSIN